MKKATLWAGAAIVAALCSFPAKADVTYYVSPSGDNANEGTTAEAPLKTVSQAIGKITDNTPTVIYLEENATFTEYVVIDKEHEVNVSIVGKNSTLRPTETLPSSPSWDRVLRVLPAGSVKLKGLVLENGFPGAVGGAVYMALGSLEVDSCVFRNNVAGQSSTTAGGSAISSRGDNADVIIKNSYFENNLAYDRYGVILQSGNNGKLIVENSAFVNNRIISRENEDDGCATIFSGWEGSASSGNGPKEISITNCVFLNNTTTNKDASGAAVLLLSDNMNAAVATVVNNTFLFNTREEVTENTPEAGKVMYKRNVAVRVEGEAHTLHFVNNVVSGLRYGVVATKATGRTINARNNYQCVLGAHGNVSEMLATEGGAADANGNVLIVSMDAPGNDPTPAQIMKMFDAMPVVELASTLTTTDNFVPYLAIDATSPLRNAGVAEYLVGDANVVPAADIRGVLRNDGSVDIGAYEYASETPGPGTGIQSLQADAWVSVYTQADRVVIENRTDADLALTLVGADGRRIVAMPLQRTLSLDRAALPQGLLLIMVQHGDGCATEKIVL